MGINERGAAIGYEAATIKECYGRVRACSECD